MEDVKAPKIDWVHLSPGVEPESLWDCLHDGELRSLTTDRLLRTARFEFRVEYVRKFGGLPEGVTFLFLFEEVTSVRATAMAVWPGPPADITRLSHEEFRAKWREESLSWAEVERRIGVGGATVSDAECALGPGEVAFQMLCSIDDELWPTLFVHAGRLRVERSDGVPFSLDELVKMGKAYWEAFAARRL